jgi:protein TonB
MLEASLFESQSSKKTRNPLTMVVSVIAHVVTVGILILLPLVRIEALIVPPIDMSMWLPHIEASKPVQVFSAQPDRVEKFIRVDPSALTSPSLIPEKIAFVDEPPAPIPGLIGAPGDGNVGSSLIGLIGRQPEIEPPSVSPPQQPPVPLILKTELFRQGGDVQAANLIFQVKPVYPPIAIQTRVQGVVVLEAIISKEGTIESLRVISGHPLLNQAALDAVKQWRYRPTLLNGSPVPVITNVTVSFNLR